MALWYVKWIRRLLMTATCWKRKKAAVKSARVSFSKSVLPNTLNFTKFLNAYSQNAHSKVKPTLAVLNGRPQMILAKT